MGTDSIIFIRTDGNSHIATGHLVRCLCIAQALEKRGKKVIFLVSDEESNHLLTHLSSSIFSDYSFSYDTIILKNARFDDLEQELPELLELFKEQLSPTLFVDSYYVTPAYFAALKSVAKLAYMDDLRKFDYQVDLLINYDVIPQNKLSVYQKSYTNAGKLLLGAGYSPLRPQFQNQEYSVKEKIENILITTGGSDPYGFCESFIPAFLAENKEITLHILIGKVFTGGTIATLEQLAKTSPFVKLHRNVTDMASLMKQCDFAISAAGTTLYELCAIGVPAVSFTFADNQITMAETFDETGAISYAGDLRESSLSLCYQANNYPQKGQPQTPFSRKNNIQNSVICSETPLENTIHNIKYFITRLQSDSVIRKELHSKMKTLVTGDGTMEIAKALCRLA